MTTDRKGFTLIELLVVIAIIAILAAILFPVFNAARAKAREVTCLSNIKNLGLACLMYKADWGEVFPPAYSWYYGTWFIYSLTNWDPASFEVGGYMGPYYESSPQAIVCPDWKRDIRESFKTAQNGCFASYGPNEMICAKGEGEITRPHRKVMIAETFAGAGMPTLYYGQQAYRPASRHGRGAYYGHFAASFCDGHAKMVPFAEYWSNDGTSMVYWDAAIW
jgi:prepilin-type N-terminal cleavage/methylation domain-containing protein